MPDVTQNLALPLMAAAQGQKHVTHNEALLLLDALVQLAVLDRDLAAPPASPAEGDRYIVGPGPTGLWSGWAGRVVRWQDGGWQATSPRPGWLAYVADEADLLTYTGSAWVSFRATFTALQNLARLGIGTTADAQNPFAAKLNKALWTALTGAEGGTGDLRTTLNKEGSGNTLSLLFQSAFSGRAEIGLTGDDDLRLKVSPDGATWREALRVDRATGGLDLAAVEAAAPVAATVDLGALPALKVALTGSGTLTSFGTSSNRVRLLRFTGAATLTHNAASLVLPGGTSLVTAAGDTALATSDAAGTWTVRHYSRASGKPLAGPAAADIADSTATGRAAVTAASAAALATAAGLGTESQPTVAGLAVTGTASATTVNASTYQLAGDAILTAPDGFYRSFTVAGQQLVTAGGGSDPSTYLSNASHRFRSRDYTTTYATLANGAATFNGSIAAAGGIVIDASRHIRYRPYTRAGLPTPSVNNVGWAELTNPEAGKSLLARNSGTIWTYMDGTAVTIA